MQKKKKKHTLSFNVIQTQYVVDVTLGIKYLYAACVARR